MRIETTTERATRDVVRWRREQLTGAAFPLALAARIAKDTRYDLHALIELAEQGCQPEFAARILAPLDGHSAA
jgi:hypothetical protein